MKPIPSDKVTVTYRGHTVEFNVESLYWEAMGHRDEPCMTLRGTGPGCTKLKLKVQLPITEGALDAWGTKAVDVPDCHCDRVCAPSVKHKKSASPWQPIETAPKDGTVVLVGWANSPDRYLAQWHDLGDWAWVGTGEVLNDPTHWMPLPPLDVR